MVIAPPFLVASKPFLKSGTHTRVPTVVSWFPVSKEHRRSVIYGFIWNCPLAREVSKVLQRDRGHM